MGRTKKHGLGYFPLDVDIFDDEKVELLSSEYGLQGEVIYIRLLCRIYRNGYFMKWGLDEALMMAKRIGHGVTGDDVNDVVHGCLKRFLFDRGVFEAHQVLTSKGIQERYIHICKQLKRHPDIDPRHDCSPPKSIIPEKRQVPPEKNAFPPEISPIFREEMPQKKVKENKVKEREWRERTIMNEQWVSEVAMLTYRRVEEVKKFCERFIVEKRLSGELDKYEIQSLTRFMITDLQKIEKPQKQKDDKKPIKSDYSDAAAYGSITLDTDSGSDLPVIPG